MPAEPFPYNLPIWRRSHSAVSANGRWFAEIATAYEVSMSNPTRGTLVIAPAENRDARPLLTLDGCNPSFLWSDDSRYLAVPRYFFRWKLLRRQRLVVIDVEEQQLFETVESTYYFQPESFHADTLVAALNPHAENERRSWRVPQELRRNQAAAAWSRS